MFWAACKKHNDNVCEAALSITYTIAPAGANINSDFTVIYGCAGPDQCSKFLRTNIDVYPNNVYEIRAVGTYPCEPANCAQAIYQAADTLIFPTPVAGNYVLNFFNNNTLVATNTVVVN